MFALTDRSPASLAPRPRGSATRCCDPRSPWGRGGVLPLKSIAAHAVACQNRTTVRNAQRNALQGNRNDVADPASRRPPHSSSLPAQAETFPDRLVKVIARTAGGGTDSVARAVSQRLAEIWGQAVVVENRAGAGTSVGSELAARATPDGYTLLFSDSSAFVINPHVYTKLRIDLPAISAGRARRGGLPRAAGIRRLRRRRSRRRISVAYAKAHPGELTYASPGASAPTWPPAGGQATWPASTSCMSLIAARRLR